MFACARSFALTSLLVVYLVAAAARAAVPVRTVAATGLGAPGTTSGETFDVVYEVGLDGLGRTAFYAGLRGAGLNQMNNGAIYSEGGGFLYLWAQAGWEAPARPRA